MMFIPKEIKQRQFCQNYLAGGIKEIEKNIFKDTFVSEQLYLRSITNYNKYITFYFNTISETYVSWYLKIQIFEEEGI